MTATFGAIAAFFVVIVTVLQLSKIRDKTFADYARGRKPDGIDVGVIQPSRRGSAPSQSFRRRPIGGRSHRCQPDGRKPCGRDIRWRRGFRNRASSLRFPSVGEAEARAGVYCCGGCAALTMVNVASISSGGEAENAGGGVNGLELS